MLEFLNEKTRLVEKNSTQDLKPQAKLSNFLKAIEKYMK